MSESELAARTTWRLILIALCLGILCTGAILVTLRADAQTGGRGVQPAAPPPPPRAAQPAPAADSPRGETPIPDDPTIAPDPHESADNNVSFPVDI